MKVLDVAIVEDDEQDYKLLKTYLTDYAKEKNLSFNISFYTYGESFLADFRRSFDLVFMDMKLSGIDGLETSKRFREKNPNAILIFVTNTEQYAIHGYEVDADDFILKPLRYASFESKLTKAVNKWMADNTSLTISIRQKENLLFVPAKNVYYIEVALHDIVYHATNGEITTYGSLSKIEQSIREMGFCRCSSWCLVNLKYVEGVYGEEVVLYTQERLHISRGKRKEFLQALSTYCLGGKL